jgi:hypothetical protein
MFDTLVESGSHSDDLARKGSFFLGTLVLYSVVLVAIAIGSIYLYNDAIPDPSLELLTLVAPVPMADEPAAKPDEPKPAAAKEQTTAMVKEMAVIAPVTVNKEVASEKAKIVETKISKAIQIGSQDIGDPNAVSLNTGGVPGGVGTGGGGPVTSAPKVEAPDEPPPPPPARRPSRRRSCRAACSTARPSRSRSPPTRPSRRRRAPRGL